MKLLAILGLVFVLTALFMTLSGWTKEVEGTYERCHTCIENGEEVACDCEQIVEYKNNNRMPIFWLFWGVGLGLTLLSLIRGGKE